MHPIAMTFEDRTFRYTQLDRYAMLALYCQEHKASGTLRYEVVRIRVRPDHTWPDGTMTPAHEAYPGASRWGIDGFTFHSQAAAQEKMLALQHVSTV